MAGNVREWCWNHSTPEGQRFILGGGWNDPAYSFSSGAVAQPPFDRSASNGFRCIQYLGDTQNQAALTGTIGLSFSRPLQGKTGLPTKRSMSSCASPRTNRTPLNPEVGQQGPEPGGMDEGTRFVRHGLRQRPHAGVSLPPQRGSPRRIRSYSCGRATAAGTWPSSDTPQERSGCSTSSSRAAGR